MLPVIIIFPFLPEHILDPLGRRADIDFGVVQFQIKHGDIFVAQTGSIAPPDNPEEILSEHRLAWDENGFRITGSTDNTYEIVALGDSYTEAANVAQTWVDRLATNTRKDIKNLGYRGYGPQQELAVLREYALDYNPEIIIVGFFGGNDLSDALNYERYNEGFILPAIARENVERWQADGLWNTQRDFYQYPVNLNLTEPTPVAFLDGYIGWMTLTQDDIRRSRHLEITKNVWRDMLAQTPEDTCIILAYFPHKAQIYLPHVQEDQQVLIHGSMLEYRVIEDGTIQSTADTDVQYQTLLDNRHNIRDVVLEAAQEIGLQTIDVTPAFEQAAADGDMLYYSYDTHWNQAGHDIAAQHIADQLDNINCN